MGFTGGMKIGLDSEMDLNTATGEPCAATFRELGRLGDFDHAQQIAIKASSGIFRPRWHCELHVIKSKEWRPGHGVDCKVPRRLKPVMKANPLQQRVPNYLADSSHIG